MDTQGLESALTALGQTLNARGLRYRLAVVGGGSLMLIGELDRPTRDLDVVAAVEADGYSSAEPLPPDLVAAVEDVALALGLESGWLNPGPTALLDLGLPPGFEERVEVRTFDALEIHLADRFDQVHFKLYAAIDQGPRSKHFRDLTALARRATS